MQISRVMRPLVKAGRIKGIKAESIVKLISIFIITGQGDRFKGLTARLSRDGYTFSIFKNTEQVLAQETARPPDLVLADIENLEDVRRAVELYPRTAAAKGPLLMVAIPARFVEGIADEACVDEFIVKPFNMYELYARLKKLIQRVRRIDSRKTIKHGHLVIDTTSCEVTFNGTLVELTFREYELLKFLASHKGQVFSREALLSRVWKYDYLGGERTVDVHIRRLRSKIEDAEYSYIDTVRNMGYRFRKDTRP